LRIICSSQACPVEIGLRDSVMHDCRVVQCRLRKAFTGGVIREWQQVYEVANGNCVIPLSDPEWDRLHEELQNEAAAELGIPRACLRLVCTTEGDSITFQAVQSTPTDEDMEELQRPSGTCQICADPVGKVDSFACPCGWSTPEDDLCGLCRVYLPDGSHRCLSCLDRDESGEELSSLGCRQLARVGAMDQYWRQCD